LNESPREDIKWAVGDWLIVVELDPRYLARSDHDVVRWRKSKN
jgi:hypothetical protein